MDGLKYLTTSARRSGGFTVAENTGNESHETGTENDESTRVRRLLTLFKQVLVIIATALTIARMIGWL